MGKKYKITEAQYNEMLSEGVTIQGETDSSGKADLNKTSQAISNSGVDPKKVKVEFGGTALASGSNSATQTVVAEHRLITKKELQENRRRYLKENSEVLHFNKFIKNLR